MNYHLLVVDKLSLKYHIEYGFVGTGNSNNNFNIGLWKDIARLKIDDKIIFYVQGQKRFYGFFKVASIPFFDNTHYLQPNLLPFLGDNKVVLQYRALIKPDIVFSNGIDEFDLIDILPNNVTDILWSVLYRKLKGGRGCSPLFSHEFNIIYNKISQINNNQYLVGNNFTFMGSQIFNDSMHKQYLGQGINPDIKQMVISNLYTEHHIHALLIQYYNTQPNILWLGNEVYSGAGMQAIDILTIDSNHIFNIIEVKRDEIPNNITVQVFKYIQWIKNRFQNFNSNYFQPIIIGYKIYGNRKKQLRINEFNEFNNQLHSLPIKYIEYEIYDNDIILREINYNNDWKTILEVIL